jgi:hypothetical protein
MSPDGLASRSTEGSMTMDARFLKRLRQTAIADYLGAATIVTGGLLAIRLLIGV